MPRISALALAVLLVPSLASGARLAIKDVSSNSILVDKERGITYGPENMTDEKRATMWVEGEGSAGLGKYIGVKFDSDVEVKKVRIWAGCFVDADFWKRHNRLKEVEFKFPDFTSEKVELKDTMESQWIEFKEARSVNGFKMYLRSVYEGTTWNDTAITAIEVYDSKGQERAVEPLKATASSEYADEDNAYSASMAADGWLDTYWVDGGASGDGEYIDIELGGRKTLNEWGIAVGWADTESFFKGSNRPGKVTLAFDSGQSRSFDLKDVPDLQTFKLEGIAASQVRLTFSKIIKGTSHDDLYVGEVRFWN